MRSGPKPLPVHLGLAAASIQKFFPENEEQNLIKMMSGIRAYQCHPYSRKISERDVLWQRGESRLYGIKSHNYKEGAKNLLLIPSLINKSYIFDLNEQHSLLKWFCARGINAYLFDWGDPERDEGAQSLDAYIENRVLDCLSYLYDLWQQPVHALGYCMGGTLLSAAAALRPDFLHSLVFLATPWDFHASDSRLVQHAKLWKPVMTPRLSAGYGLTAQTIQAFFASFYPEGTMRKFIKFSEMDLASEEAELFVAVEDWLNDNAGLPSKVAYSCMMNWVLENETGRGKWALLGQKILPSEILLPSLVVASKKDKLVPFESARALQEALPNSRLHKPDCGHIGMIAGRKAESEVWEPIANFIEASAD